MKDQFSDHRAFPQLAYSDQGTGPTMVLIHGWGVSGIFFDEQVKALSDRYRLVVPDLPGHGRSAPFPQDAGFEFLADRVADLVRELALEDICLVGWSMGAMVAWDLMHSHTDISVRCLVNVEMVPRLLNDAEWSLGLKEGQDASAFASHLEWMRDDWTSYTELFVPRIFRPGSDKPLFNLLSRSRQQAVKNDGASMAAIWAQMVEQDFRTFVSTIDVPTLIICGAQSQLYGPAACRWLDTHMPNATSETFEHSGHAPHLEEPELFTKTVSRFVDRYTP